MSEKKTTNIKTKKIDILIKFFGIFIFIIAIFLTIIGLFGLLTVIISPNQFQEILYSNFNFKIFDYISSQLFIIMIVGGYFIDLAFYAVLGLTGYYLWKKESYFTKKNIILIILILFFGIALFSYSFIKSWPDIKIPIEKIFNNKKVDLPQKQSLICENFFDRLPDNSGHIKGIKCISNDRKEVSISDIKIIKKEKEEKNNFSETINNIEHYCQYFYKILPNEVGYIKGLSCINKERNIAILHSSAKYKIYLEFIRKHNIQNN